MLREERVPYLTERERTAVSRFLERLEAECADDVQHVVLFGSKARGDHDPESDLDLLVVADAEKATLSRMAQAVEAETNVLLQPLVVPPQRYQDYRRLLVPLYVSLRRDGVELWDEDRWAAEERTMPLHFTEGEKRRMDEDTRQMIQIYIVELSASRRNCPPRQIL